MFGKAGCKSRRIRSGSKTYRVPILRCLEPAPPCRVNAVVLEIRVDQNLFRRQRGYRIEWRVRELCQAIPLILLLSTWHTADEGGETR